MFLARMQEARNDAKNQEGFLEEKDREKYGKGQWGHKALQKGKVASNQDLGAWNKKEFR